MGGSTTPGPGVRVFAAPAAGQGKTDVVTLRNGDRITGEIKRLERGRLEFSTDDAGTLYLEWDKVISVVSTTRQVEVMTRDGRLFLGTLTRAAASTTHGAQSPASGRARPTTKKAPAPSSAIASAAAFHTDMNGSSAVAERTTRTASRPGPIAGRGGGIARR